MTEVHPLEMVAVRMMTAPGTNVALALAQEVWHLMPEGLEEIEPAAARFFVSDRTAPKVAVTVRAALIESVQVVEVPEQLPAHPRKENPASGVAVRTTVCPEG